MNCNFSFSLEALIFLLWLLKLHKCIKKLVLKCPPPRTISARLSIWIILLWKYCGVKPKSKPVIVSFAATNSYLEVHAKNLELRRLDFRTLTNCARTVLSALLGFSTFCSPTFFTLYDRDIDNIYIFQYTLINTISLPFSCLYYAE